MISKATLAASKVISDYCITRANEIPLEDLLNAEGAILQEKPMNGADGRIIFGKKYSVIVVNSQIKSNQKKRFVIGHEFGHHKLHKNNLERFYNCDEKSFMEWHRKGSHESEANEFASELLMPTNLFKLEAAKKPFSMNHIKMLANYFETSITSTGIKYARYGNHPIALIYSQNGSIKWSAKSDDFICKYFKHKEVVPLNSVAYDYFKKGNLPDEPSTILAHVWFNDYKLKPDQYFYEHCLPVKSQNGVLSFIWTNNDYGSPIDE